MPIPREYLLNLPETCLELNRVGTPYLVGTSLAKRTPICEFRLEAGGQAWEQFISTRLVSIWSLQPPATLENLTQSLLRVSS